MSADNGHYDDGDYTERPDLNFNDLKPIKIKIPVMGKTYILHEALSTDVTSNLNIRLAMAKFNEDGKFVAPGNVADADLSLLHHCLFIPDQQGRLRMMKTHDSTEQPDPKYRVPLAVIRSWVGRIQVKLVETLKEISDIDQDTEETLEKRITRDTKKLRDLRAKRDPLKNVSECTTETSDEPEESDAASS